MFLSLKICNWLKDWCHQQKNCHSTTSVSFFSRGRKPTDKCCHSFFKFFKRSTSVSIKQLDYGPQYRSNVSWTVSRSSILETRFSILDSRMASNISKLDSSLSSSQVSRCLRPFENLSKLFENLSSRVSRLSSGKNKGLFVPLTFDTSES